ncbi:MAG: hypothetical protein ABR606_15805 [Vicinamibacterales bacterium]
MGALSRIEVIDRRYEGQHMARNYLSLQSIDTPDGPVWLDMSISKTNMKSAVARVTRRRNGTWWDYRIAGAAWGGHTPIAAVDVQVDGGDWRHATIDEGRGPYSWILWWHTTSDLTPGTHAVASRATDANGRQQPSGEERTERIASGREEFSIWPREIRVSA